MRVLGSRFRGEGSGIRMRVRGGGFRGEGSEIRMEYEGVRSSCMCDMREGQWLSSRVAKFASERSEKNLKSFKNFTWNQRPKLASTTSYVLLDRE